MNPANPENAAEALPQFGENNEPRSALIADDLERCLALTLDEMVHTLLLLAESNLLASGSYITGTLKQLAETALQIWEVAARQFPKSCHGGAITRHAQCRTLLEEVRLFREETFWTHHGATELAQSEETIRKIFSLYRDVEQLIRSIDHAYPDVRSCARRAAPVRPANPFETIDSEVSRA